MACPVLTMFVFLSCEASMERHLRSGSLLKYDRNNFMEKFKLKTTGHFKQTPWDTYTFICVQPFRLPQMLVLF